MRTRAFRPEVPVCLENRSLLSVAAGLSADPVVLLRRRLNFVITHMKQGFVLFGRYHDFGQLQHEVIDDVLVSIPFERVDGLDTSINRILDGMRHDFAAHVPHAVRSASKDVVTATRAEVLARVRAGDVVLR